MSREEIKLNRKAERKAKKKQIKAESKARRDQALFEQAEEVFRSCYGAKSGTAITMRRRDGSKEKIVIGRNK